MAEDTSQQPEIQKQVNKLFEERVKLIEEQNKSLTKQMSIMTNMMTTLRSANQVNAALERQKELQQEVLTAAGENVERLQSKYSNLNSEIEKAGDAGKKSSGAFGMLTSSLGKVGGAFKTSISFVASLGFNLLKLPFKLVSGGFSLLGKGLGGLKGIIGTVLSVGADLIGMFAKLAITVISFPFKIFEGLIELAQQGSPNLALIQAFEDLREALGDLARGPARDVVVGFETLRKTSQNLGETGLSLRKIYGSGIDGLAAALRDVTEMATAAGESMSRMTNLIASPETVGHLIAYNKGLGLAKEEMMAMADVLTSRGHDVDASMTEFSRIAIVNAKSFGLGIKDITKGMAALSTNVQTFGHLGPKVFAPVVAYARKLGLEIKDLAGVMDKFAGFAETTEEASKMSQAFGMNVDAMQLMAAQNPAEKIEVMRKAFFATGQDITQMNYQQRKYLASLTGLEGKSLEAAFALNQQGIGYENIEKQSREANKQQMSTQEIMIELGKQIKRVVEAMSMPHVKGFFDAFVKGFESGIMRSRDFRQLMRNIARGLRTMYRLGIEVGKAFVQYFPGVKQMIKALSDFLDPRRFMKFKTQALSVFKEFFKSGDINKFFDGVKKLFTDNFGDASGQGSKLLEGFKKFMDAILKLAGAALGELTKGFLTALTFIGNMILNPGKTIDALKSAASTGAGGAKSGLMTLLTPSLEAIKGPKGQEVIDTFKSVFEKAIKGIKDLVGWDEIKQKIEGFYDFLIKKWDEIKAWWGSVEGGFVDGNVDLRTNGEKILHALKNPIEWAWNQLKDWWDSQSFGEKLLYMLGAGLAIAPGLMFKAASWMGTGIFNFLKNGFTSGFNLLKGSGFISQMGTFIGNMFSGAGRFIANVGGGIANGVVGGFKYVKDKVPQILNSAKTAGGRAMTAISEKLGTEWAAVSSSKIGTKIATSRAGQFLGRMGGRALGAMGSGLGALGRLASGPVGALAMVAYGTLSKANEIQNDPMLKQAGVTQGEALAAGYYNALTLGMYDPMDEQRELIAKRTEEWNNRVTEDLLKRAKNVSNTYENDFKGQLKDLLKKGKIATTDVGVSADKQDLSLLYDRLSGKVLYDLIDDVKRGGTGLQDLIGEKNAQLVQQMIAQGNVTEALKSFRGNASVIAEINRQMKDEVIKAQKEAIDEEEKKKIEEIAKAQKSMEILKQLETVTDDLQKLQKKMESTSFEAINKDMSVMLSNFEQIIGYVSTFSAGIVNIFNSRPLNVGALAEVSLQVSTTTESLGKMSESLSDVKKSILNISTTSSSLAKSIGDPKRFASGIKVNLKKIAGTMMLLPQALVEGFGAFSSGGGGVESAGMSMSAGDVINDIISGERFDRIAATLDGLDKGFEKVMNPIKGVRQSADDIKKAAVGFPSFDKKFAQNLRSSIMSSLMVAEGFYFDMMSSPILLSPEVGNTAATASTNFGNMASAITALKKVTDVSLKINPSRMESFEKVAETLKVFGENLSIAEGKLSPENIANIKPLVDAVSKFKGGKIEIQHNLPNAKFQVNVTINAQDLGRAIASVNLSNDEKNHPLYINASSTKTDNIPPVGSRA